MPAVIVLALDTALAACSAAISRDGVTLASRSERIGRGHDRVLMPMLGAVLADAGLDYADLDGIAATVGPGAFTGIRIGLAAARGLVLALGRPGAGVTTLESLAARAGPGPLVATLDSGRGDFFAQAFDGDGATLHQPTLLDATAVGELAEHAGAKVIGAAVGETIEPPDPAVVARLGTRDLANGCPRPLLPLYLRAADITLPAGGLRPQPRPDG